MKARWKRNTVVAAMALLVCAAVGLNWNYSRNIDEAPAAEDTGARILGEATLVSGEEEDVQEAESKGNDGSDYFASARLTRQQARDTALSMLEEAAGQEDASAASVDDANKGIQVLAAYTMAESQVENLVTAKGYQDCVAFMSEDSISVVVATDTGELTEPDVAKIKDIAISETGYAPESVKIMAAK